MDSAVRDLSTLLTVVCSLMPRLRQEDQQPGTTDVDTSGAEALCDALLALTRDLLGARAFQRGRLFVDVLLALFGFLAELVAWVDGRLRTVADGDPALGPAREWAAVKFTGVVEVRRPRAGA